jgi:hypothetical protein
VLAEGMLFSNARIAMNDVYVTAFIVLAAALFTGFLQGRWRSAWQLVLGLPVVGVLLGLALASKWVAAYAIGGFVLLVLLRSSLGRLIALAGMIGLTAVLGAAAIRPADVPDPNRNWLFLLVLVGLTLLLAAAIVRRPVRFSHQELRFSVLGPAVAGALLVAVGLLPVGVTSGPVATDRMQLLGGALLLVAALAYLVAWIAGRLGLGPLARRHPLGPGVPVPEPPPAGWQLPGWRLGLPWMYALACLVIVPIVVYVVSYAPWVDLGNRFWDGYPADHNGQTLWQLTISMYEYHDNLREPHAASSPWWAWPLDLKPVWFYQEGFANDTTGVIYDGGNLVVFWVGIGAMIWAAVMAWARRSLSLSVVVVLFAAMWLPWSRIDRATFQYHVYTSLPFTVLALAYLLAELWHGPSRSGWLVARASAAAAILGAPLLWLLRQPLCTLANVAEANANAEACGVSVSRDVAVSGQAFVTVLVIAVGAGAAIWLSRALAAPTGRRGARRILRDPTLALVLVAVATLAGVAAARALFPSDQVIEARVGAEPLALVALVLLGAPAILVLRARDPRRLALGIAGAAVVMFLIWYPNLTGLPMPDAFANLYQGLLPTWNYSFQFAVNRDPPVSGPLVDLGSVIVGLITLAFVAGVMGAARAWRTGRTVRAMEVRQPG